MFLFEFKIIILQSGVCALPALWYTVCLKVVCHTSLVESILKNNAKIFNKHKSKNVS